MSAAEPAAGESWVLVATSIPLHPAVHGNRARNRALVAALRAAGHRVHYLHWTDSPHEQEERAAMAPLVDAYDLVRARATRAERFRLRTRRNIAHSLNCARILPRRAFTALARNGDARFSCPAPFTARARDILEGRRFTAAIASYANLAPIAALARERGVRAIIDTHDILCERADALHRERVSPTGVIVDERTELAMLSNADLVLAIQPREAEWLRARLGPERTLLVEHGIPLPTVSPAPRPAGAKAAAPRLTLVASDNKQNQHGLEWFLAHAWPRVLARLPAAELDVFGPLSLRPCCRGEGVRARGIAPDLGEVYRAATVIVNPIRAGSGLKIKSVEAMAHARALVTTSVGADGLLSSGLLPDGCDAMRVEDEPARFAEACVELLQQPDLADALAARARALCERRFDARTAYRPLVDVLDGALGEGLGNRAAASSRVRT